MSILNQIGLEKGTDKSSRLHDYLKKYEKYLPFKRDEQLRILEIGVLNGESLRTWKDYFYNSTIIGIDINPECKQHEEDRIIVEIGSQFDENFLSKIKEQYGPFDMILDDGSHINQHVIFSFEHLFNSVKDNGIYIVEDACTSYWSEYGGKLRTKGSIMEYFKDIIDEVNFFGEIMENFPNVHAREDKKLIEQFKRKGYVYTGTNIESINFMNGIILINKR